MLRHGFATHLVAGGTGIRDLQDLPGLAGHLHDSHLSAHREADRYQPYAARMS